MMKTIKILNHFRLLTKSGFTLVELIIGMAVVSIISVVVASIISVSTNTVENIQNRKEIVIDGSNSVKRFSREYEALVDLISIGSATVRFSYLKSSYSSDDTLLVEYTISNGNLSRQIIGSGSPKIVTNNVVVDSSAFYYYDQNDDLTNTLANVWRTRMNLFLESGDQSVRYIADVFPGN